MKTESSRRKIRLEAKKKEQDQVLIDLAAYKKKAREERKKPKPKKVEPKAVAIDHAAVEEAAAKERLSAYSSELEGLKFTALKARAEKHGIKVGEKKKAELIKEIYGEESRL